MNHRTRSAPVAILSAALLLATSLPVLAQSEEPPSAGAFEAVTCDTFGLNEPSAAVAECGYVTVPENRAAGTDTTIQLAVATLPSTSDAPGSPMVIGTGGPGSNGLQFVQVPVIDPVTLFAPILAARDIVFFSQRGTSGSIPTLECPAYDALDYEAVVGDWTSTKKDNQIKKRLQECFDGFEAQGVDLTAYNTVENAADVVAIKDALGYDTINYFGESYGTLLGQFLLREHEEILDSVILDGIVPATAKRYSDINDIPGAFERLFEACAADGACAGAFPNLRQGLRQAVNDLNKEPATVARSAGDGTATELPVDGDAVLDFIFGQLFGGGVEAPRFIDIIATDPTPLLESMAPSPGTGGNARGMHFAINCSDDPNTSLKQFKLDDIPGYLRAFVADDAFRMVTACNLLEQPQLPDSSDALVKSDLPALLVNGGLDPATAAANGRVVGEGLPNSQYVLFPAGGHIQKQNPCAVQIMASFLADPMAPVDTSCIQPAPAFNVPILAMASSSDGSFTLTAELAPGWVEVEPGVYNNPSAALLLQLRVLPSDADLDQAIVDVFADLGPVDASAITDGEPLAGSPTRFVSTDLISGDTPFAIDAWSFAMPEAVYVLALAAAPPTGPTARPAYPQILETVSVGAS